MKKILVGLMLVIAAAVVAGRHAANSQIALAAPLPRVEQVRQEGKGCDVPKSWGELKGVADRAIAFQDSSGTIRVLDAGPCMRGETQLIVKIMRQ